MVARRVGAAARRGGEGVDRVTLPPPRHLLVRLPNPLGDAVLATPALRGLRAALPGTRITWAGGPAALAALDGLEDRDDVVPVAGPFARGALAPFRAGRMWRRIGPDAVLLLTHSFSSGLAARRSGARVRVGSAGGGRGLLLTDRVQLPREGRRFAPRPMTRTYLDLAAPFGARDDGRAPLLVSTPFDEDRASRRLGARTPGRALVVVNPGAAFGPSKVCPPKTLGAILRAVADASGAEVLVVCGPGEEALARAVGEATGPDARTTADDPPDLGELKALLACADAVLTTDAGPRHVAEAVGAPTVVLMGPTDPRWTEGSRAVVVRNESLSCLACHLRHCPLEGHPCLEGLDPARVAAEVLRVLGSRPR
jgi:heptosyltransferase-2